ncbi:hypothetical protein [Mesorhizobium loti]|uniref:Uncharacterized protein n=1 Tax=Rhizobium loti TaxID=381 RepID=A0A6M7U3S6_RHILI|nr:hypothetical protein [Mesorhizobium loti]OBQ72376.1 hypothetical protein A8145_06075 [Mesorhizobium loti]QKC72021.1 hypothetical protein EB815_24885 [Mesorhizobium loti]
MSDTMLPILRQLHEAGEDDRVRADALLRMPDSVALKYHTVIEAACRRGDFETGVKFMAVRVALLLAVRDGNGLPRSDLVDVVDRFRIALAEFAAGDA